MRIEIKETVSPYSKYLLMYKTKTTFWRDAKKVYSKNTCIKEQF